MLSLMRSEAPVPATGQVVAVVDAQLGSGLPRCRGEFHFGAPEQFFLNGLAAQPSAGPVRISSLLGRFALSQERRTKPWCNRRTDGRLASTPTGRSGPTAIEVATRCTKTIGHRLGLGVRGRG